MAVQVKPTPEQIRIWKQHWQDESDAAYLYRRIAAAETDPARVLLFADLAEVEERHVVRWVQVLRDAGVEMPPSRPPYSCTSVKDGLVTSSSRAAPSPSTIPLTKVVLPLPNSPSSNTKQGGINAFANSRPKAMVSSGE